MLDKDVWYYGLEWSQEEPQEPACYMKFPDGDPGLERGREVKNQTAQHPSDVGFPLAIMCEYWLILHGQCALRTKEHKMLRRGWVWVAERVGAVLFLPGFCDRTIQNKRCV